MKIEHISISRKQLWDQCQQAYKYKYHLELKSNEPEPEYFLYGKLIHKVAEDYVESNLEKNIEEILKEYVDGNLLLENKKVILSQEYKKKLKSHIMNVKKISDRIGPGGKTEWKFRFDLDPPNNKIVTGVIDRLIIKDDKCFIIDYKTTKKGFWRKNSNTIRSDIQLLCYAMIVNKTLGIEAENIRAALYYLEGGDLIPTKFNQASIDKTKELLLETYNSIYEKKPEDVMGKVGQHCRRCDFRKICSWYSLT
jgi:ATP-dependent exoDNAse (exonuclease V) beta subunit